MIDESRIADRSHGRCEARVTSKCSFLAEDYHHIKQKSYGGSDNTVNVLHVCRPCHVKIHDPRDTEPGAAFRTFFFQAEGARETDCNGHLVYDEALALLQIRIGYSVVRLRCGPNRHWHLVAMRGGWVLALYNSRLKRIVRWRGAGNADVVRSGPPLIGEPA